MKHNTVDISRFSFSVYNLRLQHDKNVSVRNAFILGKSCRELI